MIDFDTVTREIHGVIDRRRELYTFLGSVFAALGVFLQNALQGGLPETLGPIGRHLFAFYGLMILVPSLVLALRLGRMHGGLVLNGMLYARLMQGRGFSDGEEPGRAGRRNLLGVSFLSFLLADLIAGFSAAVLALALHAPPWAAASAAAVVVAGWLRLHGRFHRQAVAYAERRIAAEPCEAVDRDRWERHIHETLRGANQDLLGAVSFVGLMMFSTFEVLSSFGQLDAGDRVDIPPKLAATYGPPLFAGLLLAVSLVNLFLYVRVRIAIGRNSLRLYPDDDPFRPLRLTDSLLGYVLLAFLTAVALHLFLTALTAATLGDSPLLLVADLAAFLLAIVAAQAALDVAGRRHRRGRRPTADAAP